MAKSITASTAMPEGPEKMGIGTWLVSNFELPAVQDRPVIEFVPKTRLAAMRLQRHSPSGRILLTTSSHTGISSDDRAYLIQQVGALTGLSPVDSERRVDSALGSAKTAIARSRRSSIILAFSIATAVLLGAVAAWAAACAGGRHRDGTPLPDWMARSNAFGRHEKVLP